MKNSIWFVAENAVFVQWFSVYNWIFAMRTLQNCPAHDAFGLLWWVTRRLFSILTWNIVFFPFSTFFFYFFVVVALYFNEFRQPWRIALAGIWHAISHCSSGAFNLCGTFGKHGLKNIVTCQNVKLISALAMRNASYYVVCVCVVCEQ